MRAREFNKEKRRPGMAEQLDPNLGRYRYPYQSKASKSSKANDFSPYSDLPIKRSSTRRTKRAQPFLQLKHYSGEHYVYVSEYIEVIPGYSRVIVVPEEGPCLVVYPEVSRDGTKISPPDPYPRSPPVKNVSQLPVSKVY